MRAKLDLFQAMIAAGAAFGTAEVRQPPVPSPGKKQNRFSIAAAGNGDVPSPFKLRRPPTEPVSTTALAVQSPAPAPRSIVVAPPMSPSARSAGQQQQQQQLSMVRQDGGHVELQKRRI